jgi:hypothetical protein
MAKFATAADDTSTSGHLAIGDFRWDSVGVGREIAVNGVIAMREIHIRLRRNDELKDWSIEINGRFHEHVLDEGLTDLVEGALIVAAKSLILAQGHPGNPKLAEATVAGC